ncbi:cryptochrome/photolyase family protein [Flavobacteriales bacterium]|nr:cryptochrome/photolyase family protein [Flavobacteriales bacterium]MDB2362103.1 cryptochrome/photolyase family protein [Flavobacteriales bacterium]
MKTVNIIFPNQLFEVSPLPLEQSISYLIEDDLFFKQYNFHKQKLVLHRSSMKFYESYLNSKNQPTVYVDCNDSLATIDSLFNHFKNEGIECIHFIDPVDNYLSKKIEENASKYCLDLKKYNNPNFLTKEEELGTFFKANKKKFFQTSFYINQRKKFKILIDENETPIGGKWSFDTENRRKYPKGKTPPLIKALESDAFHDEAIQYVNKNFSDNIGELSHTPLYPTNFESSKKWFDDFLQNRFYDFGIYEDAIVKEESFLNHSVITPMMNIGLITPDYVIKTTLNFADKNDIPLNSIEGFVRQIIGWREFIRGIYIVKGSQERTTNFFNFKRKIPASFYDGTTGIEPIDNTIKKILKTAYSHHIERLMILGNFMLLCEFDPDEVYQWFMEVFIDSYDWVMVPNVYGMSQFSDGGLMSTKPYFSSSNYIKKMSDYKKSNWEETWDALYWRFIHEYEDVFKNNIRMKFMVNMYHNMIDEKKQNIKTISESYLNSLD